MRLRKSQRLRSGRKHTKAPKHKVRGFFILMINFHPLQEESGN